MNGVDNTLLTRMRQRDKERMECREMTAENTERLIARWESRGGKYWVELFYNPSFLLASGETVIDAHYRGARCGGGIMATSESDAIAKLQTRADAGYFQADANKTPMHRVKITEGDNV